MGRLKVKTDRSSVAGGGARAARAPAGADVRQGARRPLSRRQRGVGRALRRQARALPRQAGARALSAESRDRGEARPQGPRALGASRLADLRHPDHHAGRPKARDGLLQVDFSAGPRSHRADRGDPRRHRAQARRNRAARKRGALPRGGRFGERGHAGLRPPAPHRFGEPRRRAHPAAAGVRADRQARLHLAPALHRRERRAPRPGRAPDARRRARRTAADRPRHRH